MHSSPLPPSLPPRGICFHLLPVCYRASLFNPPPPLPLDLGYEEDMNTMSPVFTPRWRQ